MVLGGLLVLETFKIENKSICSNRTVKVTEIQNQYNVVDKPNKLSLNASKIVIVLMIISGNYNCFVKAFNLSLMS